MSTRACQDGGLEQWMAHYADGDEACFQRLYAVVAPRLMGFFRQGGCPPAQAADLTQQTFLRLHVARGSYRRGEPVMPWIFTIAYRVRVDTWRRASSRAESSLEPEDQERLPAPVPEEESPMAEVLRSAVARLPDGQREVIELHKFQGLSMAEVAAVVGSTEGAVKLRAHRAYGSLKKLLEPLLERSS